MTTVDQQVQERVDVRIVFGENRNLRDLGGFIKSLKDLDQLLILSHVLADAELHPHQPAMLEIALMNTQKHLSIRSINYNSPLEIVLGASLISGVITTIGYQVLNLHDRFQQSRVVQGRANAEVAAYEVITEAIQRNPGTFSDDEDAIDHFAVNAAAALSIINYIEVREGR